MNVRASRLGSADTEAVNIRIPGVEMTELVFALAIRLEAFQLVIGEALPAHATPFGNGLATKTVCSVLPNVANR